MRNPNQGSATTTSTNTDVSTLHGVYFIDEIMMDILSRLPAKSLMRLKSVSKSWLSLIQKHKHFFSLHNCRSKSNIKFLIRFLCEQQETSFLTLDLFKRNIESVTKIPPALEKKYMLRPVNGLLCFVDYSSSSVLIYNLSTKEETPWITSNVKKTYTSRIRDPPICGFGFDPLTQEHKVVFIWQIDYDKYNKWELCEVVTVGENTWRMIHCQVLPVKDFGSRDSVYSNGSLYWLTHESGDDPRVDTILEFDVGKEKFRSIEHQYGIRFKGRSSNNYVFIVQVDGKLAIMERMLVNDDEKKVTKIKVWTFIEDEKSSEWIWEIIEFPFYMGDHDCYYIESIPGTDLFMITSITNTSGSPYIYFYDMKEKKFSEYGSLTWPQEKLSMNFKCLYTCNVSVIEESIYPVREQLVSPPPLVDIGKWSNNRIVRASLFLGLLSALYIFKK